MSTTVATDFALSSEELDRLVLKHDERRASSRFSFLVGFRVAPRLPQQPSRFQTVVGRDISQGGISFFWKSKPDFDQLQIELDQDGNCLRIAAEVVGSHPIHGLEPYFLVRCKFTGYLS